jgi:opacity protein-like surface antigen
MRAAWLVPLLAASCALPAQAQTAPDRPPVSIRLFGDAGLDRFNAAQSFEAIFESQTGAVYGGGAEVVLRSGWWVRIGAWRFSREGERALRIDNETFRLGIPLTVRIVPVEVSGGFRFRRGSRLVPYVGAGISSHRYEESSPFAATGENVEARFAGYQVLAGLEYRLHRWVGVAGEAQYAAVPDAIGAGGISADFGEQDLGGTIVRARFVFGR